MEREGGTGPLVLDLRHLGNPGAICAYVLPGVEPAVVDPGPATTLSTLEGELASRGMRLEDLRHVLLTHVHLDHAGAAGHIAARVPGLTVHVHFEGAPHVADPERLVASTRRTFGEAHDRLWGEVLPVPADRIRPWEPGAHRPFRGMRGFHTPGHTGHHVAWLDEDAGTLFAGDAMGIVLAADAPTHPPTPPPGVDLEAWEATLAELAGVGPERFGATHFGLHEDFEARRVQLLERLRELEARVRAALDAGDEHAPLAYEEEVREEMSRWMPRERVDRYFDVFTAAVDWAGARRYLEKKAAG